MRKSITINASFADAVDTLNFHRGQFKKLRGKMITKTEDPNEIKKDDLINIIQKYEYYFSEGGCIVYHRKMTKEEIFRELDSNKKGMRYAISRLKKWAESSEKNRIQIMEYLEFKGVKIKELKHLK